MKRLVMSVACLIAAMTMMGGYASAQSTISNTGPDSTNTITHSNDFECDVRNDTDVDVDLDVDQNASSGDATVSGNTSGGNASSGDASNSSSTNVSVDVDNSNPCAFDKEVPGVTVTPPPVGGQGVVDRVNGVSVERGVGGVGAVTALPVTGESATGATSQITVALGSLAGLSQVAVLFYRRFGLKA